MEIEKKDQHHENERRNSSRREIDIPVGLIDGDTIVDAAIVDISHRGLRLRTKGYAPPVETVQTVRFRLDNGKKTGTIEIETIWAEERIEPEHGRAVYIGARWKLESCDSPDWVNFLKQNFKIN